MKLVFTVILLLKVQWSPLMSSFHFSGVIDTTWVWPIAIIDDVMLPVTLQVKHMEATNRE